MTVIHTNEDKNFLKHFFPKLDNRMGKKVQEIHSVETLTLRRGRGRRYLPKVLFSITPPPFWGSLYTHSSPRQKEQGRFRACRTGGWGGEGREEHDWWSSGWLIKGSRECREIIRERASRAGFLRGAKWILLLCIIKLSGGLMMKIWRSGITRSTLWGGHDLSGSATLMFICT